MKIIKSLMIVFGLLTLAASSTNSYFSSQATSAGNNFSAGTWGSPPPPTPARVVINEVLFNPAGTDTGLEWIELYNAGGTAMDLTGFDLYAAGTYYHFGTFSLSPTGFVVVHINTAGADSITDLFQGSSTNMSNTSGSLALFNSSTHSSSTLIDYVEYGAGGQTWQTGAVDAGVWTAGNFVPNVAEGHSIGRSPAGQDANMPGDFIDQTTPTPGS